MRTMLYTDKYRPKKLDHVLGNKEKIDYIRQWILQIINGKNRKPLLIYGPCGIGKSSIPYAIKEEFGFDLIEMNASELRDKKRVERILGGAGLAGSLFGVSKIILIDDADILAGKSDYGGPMAIKNILVNSPHPVIVTATDIWDKKFTPIRSECDKVELKKINKVLIQNLLFEIAKKEELNFNQQSIEQIAENSDGDVRSAINDLYLMHSSDRNKNKDIFNLVRTIFKSSDYDSIKEAVNDIDYEMAILWIDENIPNEYDDKFDVARAYDSLSKGDIFFGRIKFSNWKLLKYAIDLSTFGVSVSKSKTYHKFTKYNFPSFLSNMSSSMANRAMLKSIGKKIGAIVHVNSITGREYLPLISEFAKKEPENTMSLFGFEESEIAFILGTSMSKYKSKTT